MGTARTVRGTAAALTVGTVLLAGCSGSKGSGAPADASSSTTVGPTSSLSTTSTVPQLRAAALPPCQPGDTATYTVPDWVTGQLPAGTTLTTGTTSVFPSKGDGEPVQFVTVLVGRKEHDRRSTVTVYRAPGTTAATTDPSVEWDPTVPRLGSVRGLPGTVGRTVSRSGVGPATAAWGEDGASWTAVSSLGVDSLAKALEGLTLAADGVTDPSGSFTQVGTGPLYLARRPRVTELQVRTPAASPAKERVLYLRIDQAAPGTTGPVRLPAVGVRSVTKIDGRTVLLNPFQATSATDDGAQVEISWYDGKGRPAALDLATVTAVLTGLHRRGPADAKLVDSLSLGDAPPDGAAPKGFCRET